MDRRVSLLFWIGGVLGLFFLLISPIVARSLAEPGPAESEGVSGNLVKGQKLLVERGCMKCHALWGEGGQLGPDLTRMGQDKTLLQLAGLLWGHSPKMTELMIQKGLQRPEFTPEEMNDLISYLYSLSYFSEPGDPIKGGIQFSEKGCVICHALSGKGGQIGPPLDKYGQVMSPILIAQEMWNHGPEMAEEMERHGVKRPYFEGDEMTNLLAYIRSMSDREWEERIYAPPGNPKEGERLFREKNCVVCHAIRGEGGSVGPDLGSVKLNKSVTEIAGILWDHGVKMWTKMRERDIQVPKFQENEMADLLAYLYFIHYMDPPGDSQAGEAVFRRKGCVSCHAVEGKREGIGPDLSQSKEITSPVNIATMMWNHAPVMEKLMETEGQEWPRFEGDEMRDLVAYLEAIRQRRLQQKEQ